MRHLIWSRRPSGQNACWQRTTRCDPRFERQRAVQLLQPRAPFTARPYLRPESPHPSAPCSSPRTPVDRRQHRRRRVRRSAGEAVPPVERPPFHYWRPRLATPTYAVKRPTVATQLGLWLRIDVQDEDAATSRGVSRAHPVGLSVLAAVVVPPLSPCQTFFIERHDGGEVRPRPLADGYCLQIFQITPVAGICRSGPLPVPTKCVSSPLSRTAP